MQRLLVIHLVLFEEVSSSSACLGKATPWAFNITLLLLFLHYDEIMPMQHTAIFHGCKNDNFQLKVNDNFHFLLKT